MRAGSVKNIENTESDPLSGLQKCFTANATENIEMGQSIFLTDLDFSIMVDLDYNRISRQGASLCSDADLVIVACTKCGSQFLYDEETLTIWPNPDRLDLTILNIEPGGPCPHCKATDWDFTYCDSESAVAAGPWGWALRKS